jgi:hypothetical protein
MIADDLATVASYTPEAQRLIRTACLTVAGVLGDCMDDVTVVGGLVPSLIVDQARLPPGADPHPGTLDLDLALQLAVLEAQGYRTISERLRGGGFEPDRNPAGNATVQRWVVPTGTAERVTVDFLIPPAGEARSRGIFNLERDFGAVIAQGLDLAFQDRMVHRLDGLDARGDHVVRDVWVCGPGALVVLKALACRGREKPKDAFDLFYVLRNYGAGPADVAARLRPWSADPAVARACEILAADFADVTRAGPRRVARFLGSDDDDLKAEVAAFVAEFLAGMAESPGTA